MAIEPSILEWTGDKILECMNVFRMKEGNTEEWIPGFLIKKVVIFEQINLKNKNKIRESLNRHIKRAQNKEERIMT